MRLSEFILTHREAILAEWEEFARSCAPASTTMDVAALRDHAGEMLTAIAQDLATPQGEVAQAEKSKGRAPEPASTSPTAAESHGADRAESGFTVEQMVAEYRALRASVIRLWTRDSGQLHTDDLEDLTRFNESIDQSLAESVMRYNHNLKQAKEIFIAILGHDLRLPLGAVYTSARFMLELEPLGEPHRSLITRIAASAERATAMVGDLLDFTRSRLGDGIPLVRKEMSIGRALHSLVDEISAANPARSIEVDSRGEQRGCWDEARITQALANVIGNAVQHGAEGTAIRVSVRGEEDHVLIDVHNGGPAIPPGELDGIFNAMKSRRPRPGAAATGPTSSLGLGLFIAEQIVSAHGGHISVRSTETEGTTFTIHLPRAA